MRIHTHLNQKILPGTASDELLTRGEAIQRFGSSIFQFDFVFATIAARDIYFATNNIEPGKTCIITQTPATAWTYTGNPKPPAPYDPTAWTEITLIDVTAEGLNVIPVDYATWETWTIDDVEEGNLYLITGAPAPGPEYVPLIDNSGNDHDIVYVAHPDGSQGGSNLWSEARVGSIPSRDNAGTLYAKPYDPGVSEYAEEDSVIVKAQMENVAARIPAEPHIEWPTDESFGIEVPAGRVLIFDKSETPSFTNNGTQPWGTAFASVPMGSQFFGLWNTDPYEPLDFKLGVFEWDGTTLTEVQVFYSGLTGWSSDTGFTVPALMSGLSIRGDLTWSWNGAITVRDESAKDLIDVRTDLYQMITGLDTNKVSREEYVSQREQVLQVNAEDIVGVDPVVDGQTYTIWLDPDNPPDEHSRHAYNIDGSGMLTYDQAVARQTGLVYFVNNSSKIVGLGLRLSIEPNKTMLVMVTLF
jgi:hypothetical protein